MQFICESCKANLQIADDKIRGKRLIVRCKRCGVQIRIVDPALGQSQSGRSPDAPAAASQSGSRPATGPIRTAQSGPRPSTGPIARAPARRPETDNESTRAMESEVLEKALRASKAEEAAPAPRPAASRPPPPPAREPVAPRDPAVWFAMIQGKQTGPLTRAELVSRTTSGQVGARTYLWREGMESWIRAKDVPELVPLLAAPPAPPPPPRDESAAAAPAARIALPFESGAGAVTPGSSERVGAREDAEETASPDAPTPPGGLRVPDEADRAAGAATPPQSAPPADAIPEGAAPVPAALDLARWGAAELSKPRAETPARLAKAAETGGPSRVPQFGASPPEKRGPLRAVLAIVALVVAGAILAYALLYGRKDREPAAPADAAAPPPAATQSPAAAQGEPKAEEKPAGAVPRESAAAPSLDPDELKRKVDESKPALQGCVDEALKRDPALRVGKILISTTIAPSGAVTSARIDQKAVDQSPLGACLKTTARKMQFPPFAGEAFAVDIPIVVTGAQ